MLNTGVAQLICWLWFCICRQICPLLYGPLLRDVQEPLMCFWCIEDGIKPLNKIDPLRVFSGQLNIIGDEWAALRKSFSIICNVVDTDAVLHLLLLHPLCLKTGAKLSGTFRHQKKRARHQKSKLKSGATRCKNKLWAEDCNGMEKSFPFAEIAATAICWHHLGFLISVRGFNWKHVSVSYAWEAVFP